MTQEEAIAKYHSYWWETATVDEIVRFQLYEDRLCCPFDVLHEAVESRLGRPVFTHEFADMRFLQDEYEEKRDYDGLLPSIERVAPGKPIIIAEVK